MSILTVLTYTLRPEKLAQWEGAMVRITNAANKANDPMHWMYSEALGGEANNVNLGFLDESMAQAAARESAPQFLLRLFGAKEGASQLAETSECIQSVETMMLRDRPELSYPADRAEVPVAFVTTQLTFHPERQEECEEMIRKIAEAVPKVGEPRHFTIYQPVIGNMRQIGSVRSIFDLAQLDQVLPLRQLLNEAFGAAEGGVIYRTGMEAVEEMRTRLLRVRPELSRRQE
jgi:hypothetical protein